MVSSLSTSFDRIFTDDGDDRPEESSHNPLHLSSAFTSARSAHRSTASNSSPSSSPITGRNMISSPFTSIRTNEGSSRSYMSGCLNTRTICGVQVPKQDTSSKHSNSTNHCWMSERSLDCQEIAFAPVSPSAASMNNASTSTHTTSSQSTHLTCWTTETKMARSQQRRKRLEGRFQRERSKRRTLEKDRDRVLNFVKGLLLESEEEETKSVTTRSKNNKRGKRPRTKTVSSISLFLSQYEGKPQDQSDSYDSVEDELDCYNSPNQQDANSKQQEKEELANALRAFLQDTPIAEQQPWDFVKQEEAPRSASPTESEYSSDSSYESEAEDEFPELPVKFRSIEELKSDEEVDGNDDDEDYVTENNSMSSINEREIRERDIRHAEELERHVEELEDLHSRYEQSTQEHYEELDSMERRFRAESLKREDLLERALSYAEKLEASGRKKKKELTATQAVLEQCAHEHFQKIEAIRRHQREELREQKKEVLEECALRHAKELEHLQKSHEEELSKQFDQMMQKCTVQLSQALQMRQDRHDEELSKHRSIVLEESSLRHDQKVKTLKSRFERDIAKREKIHKKDILLLTKKLKQEQLDRDEEDKTRRTSNRPVYEHPVQDETIEKLRTEGVQKDEVVQKLQDTLVVFESKIDVLENESATIRNDQAQALQAVERRLEEEQKRHANEIFMLRKSMEENETSMNEARSNDAITMRRLKEQIEETEQYHSQRLQKRTSTSTCSSISINLDLTSPTVTETPPSSCDSSLNGDEDQMVTTTDGSSQHSSTKEWKSPIGQGIIVNSF